ncbi:MULTISPECIES: hypothetical protein [unclassified Helicobacter]|uniref:hypothetical protein n=1 Tax=unclassified Helicobacter TaxID=2593540 RepID=UPI000CF0819E|nr:MULTISPECIES: hypothetical protein [unclassified Helicobacter]
MNTPLDSYVLNLDKKLELLQECQKNKGKKSCLECEKVLDCQTREEYVKAVYESMNKGKDGDFEF